MSALLTTKPNLLKEWDYTKNTDVNPLETTCGSSKKVWWKCSKGHEWQAAVHNRASSRLTSCPTCANESKMNNSLAIRYPDIAREWHPTKNGDMTVNNTGASVSRHVWWQCSKNIKHEWQAPVIRRTSKGAGCPFCKGKKVNETNSLHTLHPHIAAEWHPTKNGSLTSHEVPSGSGREIWWLCHCGNEWQTTIKKRTQDNKICPSCKQQQLHDNCLGILRPNVAKEWHYAKNGSITPMDVTVKSNHKFWWLCSQGHEWETDIASRTCDNTKCPYCRGFKVSEEMSLAVTHPHVASRWHHIRNDSLSVHSITSKFKDLVWWLCPTCTFEYECGIQIESKYRECPNCLSRNKSTSFPEQAIYFYVKKILNNTMNGFKYKFTSGHTMTFDIFLPNYNIAMEYDGTYYHASQSATKRDKMKNKLCSQDGIQLIRIREYGLSKLVDPTIYQICRSSKNLDSLNECIKDILVYLKSCPNISNSDKMQIKKVYNTVNVKQDKGSIYDLYLNTL